MNTPYLNPTNLVLEPVEIAPNTWWVGKRQPGNIFYANPYLRVFPQAAESRRKPFTLLIDPGSSSDFGVVRSKTEAVMGPLEGLDGIFINHQDPDVGSSVGPMMGRYTPKAFVMCSEDTWRLIQYYNVPRDRFVQTERFARGIKVPGGGVLIPVPSPFCHFVGAVMLYDPQTKVLFTGDLFGSLTEKNAEGLYADETDWAGMRAFHQIYMPSNQALKHAIAQIRRLAPDMEIIAPQHGRVIRGPWVQEFIRRLEKLPVGLDILEDRNATPETLHAWSTVLQRVMSVATDGLPNAEQLVTSDRELATMVARKDGVWRIESMGKTAMERVIRVLCDRAPISLADMIRFEALAAASELDLPTPTIELDEGDAPSGDQDRAATSTGGWDLIKLDMLDPTVDLV